MSKLQVICILLIVVLAVADLASSRRRRTKENRNHFRRSAIATVWQNGVIPYEINGISEEGRRNFELVRDKLAQRTCIRFRPKTDSDHFWLNIERSENSCSYSGNSFYPRDPNSEYTGNRLALADGCMGTSFFEHELGHAFGFPHEQDREDRDRYIEWDTKKPGCPEGDPPQSGKAKFEQAAFDIFYDYTSILHDWGECINPKLPGPITIGGSNPGGVNTYSVLDYEKINAVYDCGGCQSYRFRNILQLSQSQRPVVAGNDLDRKYLYICRAYHNGGILIGKSKPDDDLCAIGADDKENEYRTHFEVLTNPKGVNIRWVSRPNDFSIPRNAIIGGRTVTRDPVYIGRCNIEVDGKQLLTPGSLYAGEKELKVPFGSGVRTCTQYDVLVCDQ